MTPKTMEPRIMLKIKLNVDLKESERSVAGIVSAMKEPALAANVMSMLCCLLRLQNLKQHTQLFAVRFWTKITRRGFSAAKQKTQKKIY